MSSAIDKLDIPILNEKRKAANSLALIKIVVSTLALRAKITSKGQR
ncbi:MAG: hypothetical protein ISR58_06730 [Anaerolineales bacterium]|nr:hypothetical protein [Chloroflexota bacterium]MBL6980869.1 hypothetical protein [Anaerolineales bacterium]